MKEFHHAEIFCEDVQAAKRRFEEGLGMKPRASRDPPVSMSGSCNGSTESCLMQAGEAFRILLTGAVPSPSSVDLDLEDPRDALMMRESLGLRRVNGDGSGSGFAAAPTRADVSAFLSEHGCGVKALAVEVEDAEEAFTSSVQSGGYPSSPPRWFHASTGDVLSEEEAQTLPAVCMSEVRLYGDVDLRFLSRSPLIHPDGELPIPGLRYLSGLQERKKGDGEGSVDGSGWGLRWMDHVAGNVPSLDEQVEKMRRMWELEFFASYKADESHMRNLQTGLNSMVLSNSDAKVLLTVTEPVYGTARKSQIETYLEHNRGPGVQHIAIESSDIFKTVGNIREAGLFNLMKRPRPEYYEELRDRWLRNPQEPEEGKTKEVKASASVAPPVTHEMINEAERLGILVDRNDEGIVFQIFTTPVFERPTFFLEIIQRLGCERVESPGGKEGGGQQEEKAVTVVCPPRTRKSKGGCGGFGEGNFRELFRKVEEFEMENGLA
uniref:4-hydroxyphenylpyruvate dioxygenase n=1 Tax=Chromera velia CCMP2878 TaxID=1169474 RepID=A0A0G4GTS2_9ALVE|eukprot:Cvel_5197.t1-p1 / transcript=Cvel_5197.t1 / gene=Cvel_5197 / organism=Chromera_velia_CCMP2878 / gene_product=4-hydroxyphenylpyruvate dioxygenase, putative / transcript_product=4-hydroxyphenylpyruvate dioxygenase, putative / location=Cvel_scaffold239:24145-26497(-) / protein_length=491 / sequence_SO=supercontig / SO=protein_coding / is_pseudo=false